jgi:hypothetical protein
MRLRRMAKRLRMGTASSLANLLRREEENQQYVEVRDGPIYKANQNDRK